MVKLRSPGEMELFPVVSLVGRCPQCKDAIAANVDDSETYLILSCPRCLIHNAALVEGVELALDGKLLGDPVPLPLEMPR